MPDIVFAYITAPDEATARAIGLAVVEEKLAACANILPGMKAIYRWDGKIEEAGEVVLILKTTALLFEKLGARVRALHPYDCPCIVALPVVAGTPDYLNWIESNVKAEEA